MSVHSSAGPKFYLLNLFVSNPLVTLLDAICLCEALYRHFSQTYFSESSANDSHDRGYFMASGAAPHQVFAFPNGARRTPPQKAARIMSRKCAIVKNSL